MSRTLNILIKSKELKGYFIQVKGDFNEVDVKLNFQNDKGSSLLII